MGDNRITNPAINERLSRGFGIKQPDGIAATCAPEVQPVALVADLTRLSEETSISHIPWVGCMVQTPGAGTFGTFRIVNPVGSGVLVSLERIQFCVGAGTSIDVLVRRTNVTGGLNVATANNVQFTDLFFAGEPAARLFTNDDVAAFVPGGVFAAFRATSAPTQYNVDLKLRPGTAVEFGDSAANITRRTTVWGSQFPEL